MLIHPNPSCPSQLASDPSDPQDTVAICRCVEWPKPPGEMTPRMLKVLFAFGCYLAGILSAVLLLGSTFAALLFISVTVLFAGALVVATKARVE